MVAEKYNSIFNDLLRTKHEDHHMIMELLNEQMYKCNVKWLAEEFREKSNKLTKPHITWEEERGGTGRHVPGTERWVDPEEGKRYRASLVKLAVDYHKRMKAERIRIDGMTRKEEKAYRSAIHKDRKVKASRARLAKQIGFHR